MEKQKSLLLDLSLPFKKSKDVYLVELQALNGLKCWFDHFDKITVCAPVEGVFSSSNSSIV